MATWYEPGWFSTVHVVGGASRLDWDTTAFSVNGAVDAELVTRLQYNDSVNVPRDYAAFDPSSPTTRFVTARASIVFDGTEQLVGFDPAAMGPQYRLGVAMVLVPASAVAAPLPTAEQLFAAAKTSGSIRWGSIGLAGSYPPGYVATATVSGPPAESMQPGTKYWAMVFPAVWWLSGYRPVSVILGVGFMNDITFLSERSHRDARIISFWTNRPPNAPTIVSPTASGAFDPGMEFTLQVAAGSQDSIAGPPTLDRLGLSGIQVQYAPRPTPENPNPSWTDLPFATQSQVDPGWAIAGTTYKSPGAAVSPSGALVALSAGGVPVVCGAEPAPLGGSDPTAVKGFIPTGDWQLRARVFDPGGPYSYGSTGIRPIRNTATAWTPDTYPASNVSSWSEPVQVSVSSQVPPPIPISPTDDVAIPEPVAGGSISLSWRYRNAAIPPQPQWSREVRYRLVGSASWTTSTATNANAFAPVSGLTQGHYEWQVRVKDATGYESNWSERAFFWVVPRPILSSGIPNPDTTLDDATIGCGTHRAFIYRRGGKVRVGELRNVTHVDWARLRDDISTAKVEVTSWDIDGGAMLASLQTWAYELVLFRDNGFSQDRVWEGPITGLTYKKDSVTISAKDVMGYAYRRIIKQAMNDIRDGDSVVSRAARVLQNGFAPDDPNVLAHLRMLTNTFDAREHRSFAAYTRTAFEEVDDMAANAGLDYTVVGRSILLWSTKFRIGTLPEFRDRDLGESPIVSEYGMSMANRYVVGDGDGVWGEATRLNSEGKDPIYGLVEILGSTWSSDSTDNAGTYTQASLQAQIASFTDFAERAISDRYGPPVVVRIPDNTTINPDTVISIQHLVPGVAIPLRSEGTLRSVFALQKLDSVKVVEESGKESITISVSPFSNNDADMSEESDAE